MADVTNTQQFDKSNQADVLKKVQENLLPIEESIKAGGTQQITYEKHKQEHVGSVVNTFPATRTDVKGEFRPKSVDIEGKGSFVKNEPVPYIEAVENTRFPCGTYSLNVGNNYDLSVGAGGIGMATAGNTKIGAKGRTDISSVEEIYMSSNGNVNIAAGSNVSLFGDSMNLECPNQVVVNSNLGVAKNAIINGCAFVDGELYVNHITCPAEVQYTGGGIGAFGQLMTSSGPTGTDKGGAGTTVIAWADVSYIRDLYNSINATKTSWSRPAKVPVLVLEKGGTDLASSIGNDGVRPNPTYSIFVYPHQHPFNNVPISFTDGNESMRGIASSLNSGAMGVAKGIEHGYKTIGATLPGTI